MPKIETPGMFRERIAENFIVGETGHLAFQEGGKERIDSMIAERDAAIRSEQTELLRVCGEALHGARNHIFAVGGYDTGSALDPVDAALAALKEAGVRVNETRKNEQEAPDA